MTTALDFARRLVDLGVPVFAAKPDPDGKTRSGRATGYMLPHGWESFTASPKRLEPWQPGWALCAIGGHGLDFIDIDPRNGGLVAAQGLRAAGAWPREYAVVGTPSGGAHSYVASLGIAKTKREGIDLQGGAPDGAGVGFVFLPGTVRTSKETGAPALYQLIADSLDSFGQDDPSGATFRSWVTESRASEGSGSGEVVGELGTPIESGQHQESLFKYACGLRGAGRPEAEARALVELRAKDCVPPWVGPDSPWDAVKHAYKAYAAGEVVQEGWHAEQGPFSAAVLASAASPQAEVMAEIVAADPARFACIDWHALWAEPDEDDWVLRPLIGLGRSTALYSAPKVGKSILMLELAVALSRGRPALGMVPAGPTRVLYVDYENHPRGDVRARLRSMGLTPDDLENLRYQSFPGYASLDSPLGGRQLLDRAAAEDVSVVIIDTVVRTVEGEENSNDTWKQFYNHTGKHLKSNGIAYVRLDHSGKDDAKGMRGGSAKSGDVDMIWKLSRTTERGVEPEEFLLECEDPRVYLHSNERAAAFRRLDNPLRHERIALPSKLAQEAKAMHDIWAAMDEAGYSLPINAADGTPIGVRALATKMRADLGIAGRHDLLGGVARTRWACLNNAFAARPEWAPEQILEREK